MERSRSDVRSRHQQRAQHQQTSCHSSDHRRRGGRIWIRGNIKNGNNVWWSFGPIIIRRKQCIEAIIIGEIFFEIIYCIYCIICTLPIVSVVSQSVSISVVGQSISIMSVVGIGLGLSISGPLTIVVAMVSVGVAENIKIGTFRIALAKLAYSRSKERQ